MKKYSIVIGIVVIVLGIYLVAQNNQLKQDLNTKEAKADELNDYIAETDRQSMNFEASDAAEEFIRAYYDFTDHPEEDDVEGLVTDEAKELLDFGDISQSTDEDQVESEVKSLDVYYGEATDNRQELFATFNNVITYNEETSEQDSYIKMDMLQENDQWKVDDFEFKQ